MSKPVKTFLACVALLAAIEVSLQAWFSAPPPLRGIPPEGRLAFVLGTSRTMVGLDPATIESTLHASGVADAWVGNVSDDGVTNFGMFDFYMSEIRPLAVDLHRGGVLAIEVRASGFNDNYATPVENDKWARGEYRDLVATARNRGTLGDQLERLDLGAAAKTICGFTALGSGRETLRKLERRLVPGGVPKWAAGAKGFRPDVLGRHDDLDVEKWRFHYQNVILRNFDVAMQKQFPMLQLLAGRARKDGFDVVLYVMPVTDLQRSFWKPPALRAHVLNEVKRWAQGQGFPYFDFDAGNTLTHADFFNTHHLAPAAAERFSREFATTVLLPRMRN